MTPHDHRQFVPGCFRCELGRDEAMDIAAEPASVTDDDFDLDDIEVDNPGGIDYDRWAQVLLDAKPMLCRPGGCRRCNAEMIRWEQRMAAKSREQRDA